MSLAKRYTIFAMLIISLIIMVVDRYTESFSLIHDILNPVVEHSMKLITVPKDTWNNLQTTFKENSKLLVENKVLKQNLYASQAELTKLNHLELENSELRKKLDLQPAKAMKFIFAEVKDFDHRFSKTRFWLNKGKNQGVNLQDPVVGAKGLVGQVIRVRNNSSEVLLLSDPKVHIPVYNIRTKQRAILQGASNKKLKLNFLPHHAQIEHGDLFVSSGLGGVFPVGIPVAKIETIYKNPSDTFLRVYLDPVAHTEVNQILMVLQSETN